ncbi:sulfurtransferase TusA family protein [Pontivivens ytuae]|uniref:Sulfurtransferase TusA family protein n=1 Tax=Pontivivens ytuae TaxID=2789856 RepID=A0A7S9QFC1_9RHOB|nr:sulfurtransferase TusA family protein [Pontivivens ytuae]QPH56106.1 sulfurtransferase TusA family protein [Pontivivens ytuae]
MTAELDATGLLCPLPVLKARKRLQALAPGETLSVRTDDPAAVVDIPHFCTEQGHVLHDDGPDGKAHRWRIVKGGA